MGKSCASLPDSEVAVNPAPGLPDGSFQIDVAPGQYEVVIRAPGYREQRRSVTIEEGGVLILNVDLRAQK